MPNICVRWSNHRQTADGLSFNTGENAVCLFKKRRTSAIIKQELIYMVNTDFEIEGVFHAENSSWRFILSDSLCFARAARSDYRVRNLESADGADLQCGLSCQRGYGQGDLREKRG
jgi:hypothetical protein